MKKLVVALDIDGVVLNFMQSITKFMEQKYGVLSSIDHCHDQYSLWYRFDKDWVDSIGWDQIKDEFAKAGGWATIEPMRHTEYVRTLFTNPMFDVHIVTMIDPAHQADRKANLETLLGVTIPLERLICVPLSGSKKPVIESLQPDVFIDDSYGHIEACAGNHVSIWVDTVAFDKGVAPESKAEGVLCVRHFDEAFEYMTKLAHKRHQAQLPALLERVPDVLSDDLLQPMYRNLPRQSKTEGHCYAAAEALYHLLGGAKQGYTPQVARFTENGVSLTHWWLKTRDGQIVDPTASQFTAVGQTPPYDAGKGAGFLTRNPSKRAQVIMQRLLESTPDVTMTVTPGM